MHQFFGKLVWQRQLYPIAPNTCASVGNAPVAFFEYVNLPSTVISNTPPPLRLSVTAAFLFVFMMRSRAARARGS
jgi:hypothetical protein